MTAPTRIKVAVTAIPIALTAGVLAGQSLAPAVEPVGDVRRDLPPVLVTVTAAPTATPTVTETVPGPIRTVTRAARSAERASPSGKRGPTEKQWAALRHCESTDRPGNVSGNGLYHGLYQFDLQTWKSVGGTGLPSQASRAEQDKRAQMLYDSRGAQPWPICGKHLG